MINALRLNDGQRPPIWNTSIENPTGPCTLVILSGCGISPDDRKIEVG